MILLVPYNTNYQVLYEDLYESSFPKVERRDTNLWLKLLENKETYALSILSKDNKFCGFFIFWIFSDFIYIEHFAILSEFRNKGIGTEALSLLKEIYSHYPIILEVEKSHSSDIALQRINFYKRNGFEEIEYKYQQPPYRNEDTPIPMLLMTNKLSELENKIDDVVHRLIKKVYKK